MAVSALISSPQALAVSGSLQQPSVTTALVSTPLLVVFDSRVPDLEVLYQGLLPGAIAYTLNAQDDALSVITQLLTETGATRLAIVAHGEPGVVHLGATPLNREQVQARSELLREWGVESIALYSCEVAKGDQGRSFVHQLSELTGTSVAASTTKTGSEAFDGNWQLEVKTGESIAPPAFQPEAMADYTAVLAAGDLDSTFGTGGKVTTDFNNGFDEARDVLVQPDGKVVVAGYAYNPSGGGDNFALSRYNSDGSLDTSFGAGGKVTTDFSGSTDYGQSVAQQSDGKIVVAGFANTSSGGNFALSRYNNNGTLDLSFGNGGKVITDFNGYDEARDIVVQPDGKIVVAGYAYNTSGGNYDFGLSRYNNDGSLDTSFGNGGKVTTDFNGSNDIGFSVTQQSDGKLVVTGYAPNPSGGNFALSRYNSDGSLDTSFGAGGKVTTDFNSSNDIGVSVTQQSDGKIVAAGYANNPSGTSYDFALSRYNSNGSLDTSFGNGGKVTTDFNGYDDYGYSVTQQSDGKLVVAGYAYNPSGGGGNFALSRYNSNGSLDTSFGNGGKITTDFNSSNDIGYNVAIQPDGNIILVGTSDGNFTVARYLGNNQSPTDLSLSSSSLAENSSNGTVVGSLTTSDLSSSDTHTYTLLNNAGGRFALSGNQVVVADGSLLNYEAATNHTIRVRTTDNSGLSYEEDLMIGLSNVNEAPTVALRTTVGFSGRFTYINDNRSLLDGSIGVGTTLTGSYTFDPSTLDSNNAPDVGDYRHSASGYGIVAQAGSYTFQTDPSQVDFLLEVVDRARDNYLLRSYNNLPTGNVSITHISWQLDDPTGTALNSDSLPQVPPDLSKWSSPFGFNIEGGQNNYYDRFLLRATIDSIDSVVEERIANQNAVEDFSFTFTIPINTFTDADAGDTLTYTASLANDDPLPTWLSFDPTTRTFIGTPLNQDVGSLSLEVTVTDSGGASVSNVFSLAIANTNDAPSFTGNATLPNILEDTTNFAGQTIASLFSGLVSDPDAGASLKGVAVYSDPANSVTQGRWQYSVNNGSGWFDVGFNGDLAFALPTTALIRFVPVANYNGTPPGLVVRALDNTYSGNLTTTGGVLYIVNTQTVGGTSPISANTATIGTTVTSVNDVPTATGTLASQKALQDFAFSFTVPANTFSDADVGDPLTHSATLSNGNPLPAWLTFNPATRTFSGTPTAGDLGNLAVQVIATDSAGASTSTPLALSVAVPKPGDLDLSFGDSGKVIGDVGIITSTLVQPDGKVVVAGRKQNSGTGDDFVLTRYNATGALDTSFGNNGSVTTHVNFDDMGRSVALQTEGKILVAGITAGNFAVLRYIASGAIDPTFGSNGVVTTDFGRSDEGYKVLVQTDGKVVVTGTIYSSSNNYDFGLARYNSDGTVDTTFGTNGKTTTHIVSDELAFNAAIQTDGKIVVAGTSDGQLALVRYNTNGTLDTTFGTNGIARTNLGGVSSGRDLVIQPDGKILVAGDSTSGSYSNFAIVRYNANGTIDTSFGTSGVTVTDFSNSEDYVTGVALQSNGKVVVGGFSRGAGAADFALVRYNSNGTIDNSFGNAGKVITNLGGDDYALDLALQPDGAIVAAGYSFSNGSAKLALARYLGDRPNQAPTDISLSNSAIAENSANGAIVGSLTTLDPDNSDTQTYTLLNDAGGRFALSGNQVVVADGSRLNYEAAANHTIRVRTTDNSGLSYEEDLAINLSNVNEAPVVSNAIDAPFLSEDSPFTFTIPETTFSDVDGDTLVYTATHADASALPDWLSFDAVTRTFSGTPPQDAGSPSITVTASDGQASASATFMLSVSNVNDSPVLVSPIADQAIAEGSELVVSLNGVFSDPDSGLSVRATLENGDPLPGWLEFNGGSLRGTPGNSDVGTLSIKVTAADNRYEVSDVFTLTVNNVNEAPVVSNAIIPQTAIEDVPFSFTIPANAFVDSDGDALTYTATLADGTALPNWLTFNPAMLAFSGTADDADLASLNVKVTATDPSGLTAAQEFQIAVNPTDDPTIIAAPSQQTINEDTSLVFSSATGNAITLADADAGNSLLRVSLSVTNYSGSDSPGFLTLGDTSSLSDVSEDGRSFRGTLAAINAALEGLSFYPSGDYNGIANLQVMVSNPDTGAASSNIIPILVNPINDAPSLHLGIAPTVNEDEPFSFFFSQAYDPDDRYYGTIPITYSAKLADGSDLPDWMSFDPNARTFSGTPTNANVGNLNVEVTASDGEASSSEVFTLTIANVNDAPALTGTVATLTGSEDTTYTIAATTLLQGFTDADGDLLSAAALTATNGSLIDNSDGTYSFTPAANFNGTVNLTYNVIDGNGGITAVSQSLAIAAVNDPVTGSPTATLVSGIEDTAYTVTAATLLQGFSDVDSATNGQSLSITNLVASNGTLALNPDGISWTVSPAAHFNGNLVLTYDVTDDSGSTLTGQTRSFNLAAVSDAPLAAGTATLAAIDEGVLTTSGATVNSLFATTFSDSADQIMDGSSANPFTGIAIVGNAAPSTQGVWQYSSNGSSWTTISTTVSNTSARSLSPTALLRFLPTTNFSGAPGTLSVRLVERVSVTNGALINVATNGGSTAYSATTVRLNTTITPINDAPVLTSGSVKSLTTIKEDPTTNPGTLVSTFLGTAVTDVDANALRGIAVTSLAGSANGTWQYSSDGSSWSDFGSVSATSALLLSSSTRVRFTPALNYNGSVSLGYRAWDQTSGSVGSTIDPGAGGSSSAFSTAIATSNLAITPVNDAPALTGTKATLNTGNEDTLYTLNATDLLTGFSDVEGNTLAVANLKATNGTLSTYNSATGTWTFTPSVNYNGTVNLSYSIADGKGGSLATTQSFAIAAINDAPVNKLPTTLQSVFQGSSLVFSTSNRLSISDVDANSALAQITLSVSHGKVGISNAGGLTSFSGNNTGSLALQGTVSGLNSALDGLRFTPDAEAVLAGSVNLTIVSSDLGNTGAGSAQTDLDILAIVINRANPIQGTSNNDTLTGSSLSNFIQGLEGDDMINGNGGQDMIFGGSGADTIRTGSGNDFIDAGFGNDTIYLGGGQDTLVLASGNGEDTIYGYAAGSTRFKLDAGLSYSDVSIMQSGSSTLIRTANVTLASLANTQANTLSAGSFS